MFFFFFNHDHPERRSNGIRRHRQQHIVYRRLVFACRSSQYVIRNLPSGELCFKVVVFLSAWQAQKGLHFRFVQAVGAAVYADIAFSGTNVTVLADSWYNHGRFYCTLVDMPDFGWVWFNQ